MKKKEKKSEKKIFGLIELSVHNYEREQLREATILQNDDDTMTILAVIMQHQFILNSKTCGQHNAYHFSS
ncbi:hypothetical protein DERF_004057 [Dermatophagoides farinae]|uniref:Uncharacterized protein n=1 Tax=Dermatophagoides farinae TaxID=6954 RepID=A0A922IEZ3_DERFA|nr:hypothetical protein DERF_004057 [Dermatophagoides farinae]